MIYSVIDSTSIKAGEGSFDTPEQVVSHARGMYSQTMPEQYPSH